MTARTDTDWKEEYLKARVRVIALEADKALLEKRVAELEKQNEALIESADRHVRSNYPEGCRDLREKIAELEKELASWKMATWSPIGRGK